MKTCLPFVFILLFICRPSFPQGTDIRDNYIKREVYITMRDGIRLFTAIYTPRDNTHAYPIMIVKTPYGIRPYGGDNFPERIGPSAYLEEEQYIFVHQDARGMFMSEGYMDQMTPYLPQKPDSSYTDNSSDIYDTVEWLLKNTKNNGKVGLWGISYRGFYASSGIIDAHPAIECSSPQAPIADWYIGDDMHHNGAFSLLPAFSFLDPVGRIQTTTYKDWLPVFQFPVRDAYNFFLNIGKLTEVNDRYFQNQVPFWDSIMVHADYDDYWQKRDIRPHLKNIRPAVLVTGGLFDQENWFGSLETYKAIKSNSDNDTRFTFGPWIHGGWARTTGENLGPVHFGQPTSDYYQKNIETPFFNYYLKNKGILNHQPVKGFITGINTWQEYGSWPPANAKKVIYYMDNNFSLSAGKPSVTGEAADQYMSDPANPVPYTQVFHPVRLAYNKEYMTEDQRFASARPDVLSYQTEILIDTHILAGPVIANLFVSADVTDFDIVIKIIDVYPDADHTTYFSQTETEMAGYQQLVRGEILRMKYRHDPSRPEPFTPGKVEKVTLKLNDICHAFLPGHRIMIQIQSSWFPLYDRNPQQFMNIYQAGKDDYRKAMISIYHTPAYPSAIIFNEIIE